MLVIMLCLGFEALASVHDTCEQNFEILNKCKAKYVHMEFQRNCLAVLCTVLFIACIMLAWSQSRTAKMTSDDAHDSANQQDLAKHLEMEVKQLTLENYVYNEMLKEQSVNVAYCVILGPLLKFQCMPCFYLCKDIKQVIKYIIHWNFTVDVIFYHVVLLPFIAICCVGYEIWSKKTVSPDVMLSAMNTTLKLVMTPGMMVWDNIKPFVGA
jgi:hypothetical protein